MSRFHVTEVRVLPSTKALAVCRTVVDEEGLTGSAHDQERRELIGSEAASSKKGGSGNAHGSQIDSALADASLQDDLDSADAAKVRSDAFEHRSSAGLSSSRDDSLAGRMRSAWHVPVTTSHV